MTISQLDIAVAPEWVRNISDMDLEILAEVVRLEVKRRNDMQCGLENIRLAKLTDLPKKGAKRRAVPHDH